MKIIKREDKGSVLFYLYLCIYIYTSIPLILKCSACLLIHVALILRREIRSREGNKKKYGAPDVKMPKRKKRWRVLMIFKIDRDSCCKMFRFGWASPGGLLFKTGLNFCC
jgi:hypothetical protein